MEKIVIENFKITPHSLELIKEENKKLMKMKIYDKLSNTEKYIINNYKGPSKGIDKYGLKGYNDYYDYQFNKESFNTINLDELKSYVTLFNLNYSMNDIYLSMSDIDQKLKKILKQICDQREKNIIKCINHIDQIISKGISYNGRIYRIMSRPFDKNMISNFTSWSLHPQIGFCGGSNECHVYVTKMPSRMKAFYVESDIPDKMIQDIVEFSYYEFELILPRNLEFKEIKSKKIFAPDFWGFSEKNKTSNNVKTIYIHWIKILRQHKNVQLKPTSNKKISLIVNS